MRTLPQYIMQTFCPTQRLDAFPLCNLPGAAAIAGRTLNPWHEDGIIWSPKSTKGQIPICIFVVYFCVCVCGDVSFARNVRLCFSIFCWIWWRKQSIIELSDQGRQNDVSKTYDFGLSLKMTSKLNWASMGPRKQLDTASNRARFALDGFTNDFNKFWGMNLPIFARETYQTLLGMTSARNSEKHRIYVNLLKLASMWFLLFSVIFSETRKLPQNQLKIKFAYKYRAAASNHLNRDSN